VPFDQAKFSTQAGNSHIYTHRGRNGDDSESAAPPLELIPLGGLGEFGMNMMLVACGETAILVDAGVMFPEPELLGVDLIIPDLRQLQQYRIQALVFTGRS
jgi:ribonuclease J